MRYPIIGQFCELLLPARLYYTWTSTIAYGPDVLFCLLTPLFSRLYKWVEKRHERLQDRAKFGAKAQFMGDK